jgi:hypothetical protein
MRKRSGSVVNLSYLRQHLSTMVGLSSGHYKRFKKPESVKLKRTLTQRLNNTKRRRINYGRYLRKLRRRAC